MSSQSRLLHLRCLSFRLVAAVFVLLPPTAPSAQTQDQGAPPQFGAIAFTADGSFASAWKQASKSEAEAKVGADCARFERGKCEVVSFRAELCAAIASFQIDVDRKVTYAGGGLARADAQRSALERCNRDERAHKSCKLRTVVCADGR